MKLTLEETDFLERAKTLGYVTSDMRDNYDAVTEAYRDWCRIRRLPFLHIALGEATSRVIFSLLEADATWRAKTETQMRQRIPALCLCEVDIEIEPDYLIAGRVVNELLPELREWLLELSNDAIHRIHQKRRRATPSFSG